MWSSRSARLCVFATLAVMVVVGAEEVEDVTTTETNLADDVPQGLAAGPTVAFIEDVFEECGDNVGCARQRLARLLDDLEQRPAVELVSGVVTLRRTSSENDTKISEEEAGERLERYLRNHVVELVLPQGAEYIVSRVLRQGDHQLGVDVVSEQSEGRGRIRKLVLPLLLLVNLKSFIVMPILLTGVLLVAFKGLWAGLAALLVSGAIGLRQLFKGNEDTGPSTRFTVGVVKPHIVPDVYHHSPGPDYWHGWSRSGPPLPPPSHDSYPYRGYYPSSSAAWPDRPLVP